MKDLTPHNVLRADEGEGVALTFALCQELQKNCRLRQVGNVVQVAPDSTRSLSLYDMSPVPHEYSSHSSTALVV